MSSVEEAQSEEPQHGGMDGFEVVQPTSSAHSGADQPQDEESVAPTSRLFGLSLSWGQTKKPAPLAAEGSDSGEGGEQQDAQAGSEEDDGDGHAHGHEDCDKSEDKDDSSGTDEGPGGLVSTELARVDPQRLLGCRVELKWSSGRWYKGTITSFDADKRTHKVCYDDGDVRSYELDSYVVRFLQVEDEWILL